MMIMKNKIIGLLANERFELRVIASELNLTKRALAEILKSNAEFVWHPDDKTWGLREVISTEAIDLHSSPNATAKPSSTSGNLPEPRKNRWRNANNKNLEQGPPPETSLSPTVYRIQEALRLESEATPKNIRLQIKKREKVGDIWKLAVVPNDRISTTIDESLEGSDVWWPHENGNGKADVLAVLPEEKIIHLRYCSQIPPKEGECIFVYLPRYIDAIINIWRSSWAEKCISWLKLDPKDF